MLYTRGRPKVDGDMTINQLYIDTGTEYDVPFGHQFAGYFMPFAETQFEGLVSTICDDPPIM
jgi:hypothetical protein